MQKAWIAAGAAAAALAMSGAARAEDNPADDPPGDEGAAERHSWWNDATVSFVWENDIFGGTDQNYTNGVQLSVLSELNRNLPLTRQLGRILPDLYDPEDGTRFRTGFGVGQVMFTPQDISLPNPDPNDRPYAGWTFLSLTLLAETRDRTVDTAQLQVGVIGPASGAEWVQTNWHRWIDAEDPQGWDYQLHNEPAFVLRLERAIHTPPASVGFLDVEADFQYGAAIGTVETSASLGGGVRVGERFGADYGPPRIRPALGGASFFDDSQGVGWYLFAGVNARAVARDIFLDGNTFRDSRSVSDRNPLVADLQGGLAITAGRARVSFTYVHRTEEFAYQDGPSRFGASTISWRF